jgi:uncharacterized damage-inducible protein DinB
MDALDLLRRSLAHSVWADDLLFDALRDKPALTSAWREYTHVLGAGAVWLARLEQRPQTVAVWPTLTVDEADELRRELGSGYERFLNGLDSMALERSVEYTNSAGQTFRTPICDILQHVALHGQYHRGKINLLLRQGGCEPVPTDFIAYVRGVPAAVTRLAE